MATKIKESVLKSGLTDLRDELEQRQRMLKGMHHSTKEQHQAIAFAATSLLEFMGAPVKTDERNHAIKGCIWELVHPTDKKGSGRVATDKFFKDQSPVREALSEWYATLGGNLEAEIKQSRNAEAPKFWAKFCEAHGVPGYGRY